MSIEQKPGKAMMKFLITMIRTYLNRRSKIIIEHNDTVDLKPPYIILANHVTNWDPLYINLFVKEPISFVAGDSLFRNPLLKRLLDYTGAIPKTKFKSDTRTIRSVLKAKKHHRVIGLFPEGNRNWDGNTEPLTYGTAKLIKMLDIPVVIATISGGHLSHPRWAVNPRKGLISISLQKKWAKGELSKESAETIHKLLTEALAHDEMNWQKKAQVPYYGKNLAHYLERFLFICPHCQELGQLRSDDNLFRCKNCDYTVRYTPYGVFEEVMHPLSITTTHEWNLWQLGVLEGIVKEPNWGKALKDHVKLFSAEAEQPFTLVAQGYLVWRNHGIALESDDGQIYPFLFNELEGINIHLHHHLEFYIKEKQYQIEFYQPRTSAYKWLQAIKLFEKLN
ncbi:1-acyl-sn-glycerol-3-phosphate acyltransferase [Mesobacillus persicus]|uniref:1-acyl-sn-glycerol-3-phosphate acyltransferase n=1 Tax=Mesobacillus persicus TaxID=930146 RepID=A0A1H8GJG1_9BACI|nr:lysophospholipid acyltransferase family protein [Mesobacillus persicus]SEN44103.1 1-acyl-sn-glycerol-3-phosphate acyltransferase [Mesobacillus persicus]